VVDVFEDVTAVPEEIVRVSEWHRVRDFFRTSHHIPAAVALVGEAGAGKSTLWREGVRAAQECGQRLLVAEASAAEADQSFTGLSDLLAAVLPEVAANLPVPQLEALEVALLLRPPGEAPPTPRAIGLGVLSVLRSCLSLGPVAVAVDDAQWLDDASRDALIFALRRLTNGPLSLLVAARTTASADPLTFGVPPPSPAWRDLLGAVQDAEQIDLTPLEMAQIQRLLPLSTTPAELRIIAEQSRGNPFWAKEVSASLESGDAQVPPAARALSERLARSLTTEAAEALATVAAAGHIAVPAAVAALDQLEDPLTALDVAVTAGVLVEADESLTVAHPLIGAAAVGSLPPGRRRQLYRRLATSSSNPERRAHFAALAAGPGPDVDVAAAMDAAAASAHSRAGNAAAAQFAQQAVMFTSGSDDEALVRRRIRAAELLNLAGDLHQTLGQLEALDTGQLATPELERAFPLLLDVTDLIYGQARAVAIVTHHTKTPEADPRRRALIMALASDMWYGPPGGRQAAATEAIRCAELSGAVARPTLHRALVNLAIAKVTSGAGLDTGLLDRARALERDMPDLRAYDSADLHLGLWSRVVEDLDGARGALHRSIARARDLGDDYAVVTFLSYLADTELLAGNYSAAASAVDQGNAVNVWHDWPPSPWHLQPRCDLHIVSGDLASAASIADRHLADDDEAPLAVGLVGGCVRGQISMWSGDAPAAAKHFERARSCADQNEWTDPGVRLRLDPALAEAYVSTGRLDDASRISSRLREIGDRLNRPTLIGDASRIDALVAATSGDLEAAAQHADAAVRAHAVSPIRLEEARSLLTLGRIERRRKQRKQSRAALYKAQEVAVAIGHRPLQAEVQHELPRLAATRSGLELTTTEQRVAALIGEGATNREAAAELFVSVRTIETHVASIYRKLGVRSRSELVRRLSR
jgi:DNA-binding CsgD family transcriptional regulator